MLDFISQYGNPQILLPYDEYVEGDLLILPGGPDIASTSYNQPPSFYTSNACQFRQFFLDHRLKNYIGKIPVIGICMGHQALNIFFSGGLQQHISHYVSDKGTHELYDMNGNVISRNDKKKTPVDFTSTHHQGFYIKELGEGLIPIYQSGEGFVEAMQHESLKIASVQYHPERMVYDAFTDNKIKEFLK